MKILNTTLLSTQKIPPPKMKLYRYQAFGLTLQSDIELFTPLSAKKYARTQIKIAKGKVNKKGLTKPKVSQLHFQASPGKLWLEIPAVGWFLISNGEQIKYQGAPKVDNHTLRLFLLGTCMAALLHQRNLIVLRATAVKFKNEAVVFASFSSEGKTTLAAVMHKQGYKILTDDICVIDDNHKVLPGYPMLKLWQDCFKVMGIKPGTIPRIRPQVAKYAYPLDKGFCTESLPIKAIYILKTWNKDQPELNTITGIQKIIPLQSQTYRLQYLEGLGLALNNMKRLMHLAGKIKLCHVTRPQHAYKVSQLIEFIRSDIKLIRGKKK